jgi:hypothetical protein
MLSKDTLRKERIKVILDINLIINQNIIQIVSKEKNISDQMMMFSIL